MKNLQECSASLSARKIVLSGLVQGVGFRPFIYRLAIEYGLLGWVKNCVGVVEIHVQGQTHNLDDFQNDIFLKKPPIARPRLESEQQADIGEFDSFSILQSQTQGDAHISVPNDLFLCDDCLAELYDPSDRRHRYPFINCTQCGPRYTLIRALPYDRSNTTMAAFYLCPLCHAEYTDPANRRFHAEPVACPACGPVLSFHNGTVAVNNNNEASLAHAVAALHQGKVIAVKGIGGYHLMCDAGNTEAVMQLRRRKPRPDKPLAVMFPAPLNNPFKFAQASVALSDSDKVFLLQASRPILLAAKTASTQLSEQIAPGLNEVGIMLPYSPLHHLLLNDFGGPLVATSANLSGEPVLTENSEVEKRLAHVADGYLHHNRAIARPADDPVYRTIAGKARPIRSGRGSAPMELTLPFRLEQPVLAVGAQMKNTITLAWGNRAVTSPHIGEMDCVRSLEVFENAINDLQKLYGVVAEHILCDAHPGYTASRWANKQLVITIGLETITHNPESVAYDASTDTAVLVFTWDGVGYGEDGTLWGGETLLGKPGAWQRVASMRPFHLPGGNKAGREPWRSAAALCWETGQSCEQLAEIDPLLKQAWQQRINTPQTTSVGRLFDAAAALTGVRSSASFEGQGPMELEALCNRHDLCVDITLEESDNLLISNWEPLVAAMLDSTLSVAARAALLHTSLAQLILKQAKIIRDRYGVNDVSFAGGVFQNRVLTEQALALLSHEGFEVHLPELIAVNDAGISFGQVMEHGYAK